MGADRDQKIDKISKTHEVKKITLCDVFDVLSWVYGVLFALFGFPMMSVSLWAGLVFWMLSAALLPPINKIFRDKLNLELSRNIKITVIIIGLILVVCIRGNTAFLPLGVIFVMGGILTGLHYSVQLILKSKQHKNEKSPELKSVDGKYVKEIKCKCNECGQVWHYLEAEERRLRLAAKGNALTGCCGSLGMCGGMLVDDNAVTHCMPAIKIFTDRSQERINQAEKLKKCPKCGSDNITKMDVYHEKK